MTLAFAFLLGVIFLMEVGAGIAAYQLRGKVKKLILTLKDQGVGEALRAPPSSFFSVIIFVGKIESCNFLTF